MGEVSLGRGRHRRAGRERRRGQDARLNPGDKAEARAAARSLLRALPEAERAFLSARASAEAFKLAERMGPRRVLAFLSMRREIDTAPFIDAAFSQGWPVAVPRISGGELVFTELGRTWNSWPLDGLGIPEPPVDLPMVADREIAAGPTFALIPGLLFDGKGRRLGRGKGYYDRFLARIAVAQEACAGIAGIRPEPADFARVGFCFSFQVVEGVPYDGNDAPMDLIVTENGTIRPGNG